MTVLVTRGWPGAERTVRGLRQMGIEPIITPVLDINFRAEIKADLNGVQALAFTSANGVRAWGPRRPERDLPVYAVAATTAETARETGFDDVRVGGGKVDALAAKIIDELDPADGAVLHVRGIHVAGDLKGALKAAGFQLREAIGYGAVSVDQLNEKAIAALVSGGPVSVLIHSARGAKSFLDLVRRFGLEKWLRNVTAYGISEAALTPLAGAEFAARIAAPEPNEPALLDLLDPAGALARRADAS